MTTGSRSSSIGLALRIAALAMMLGSCAGTLAARGERCERGGYQDSATVCQELAATSTADVDRARYRTLAARASMWSCKDLGAAACGAALDELWLWSSDPAEVSSAVRMSQDRCRASLGGCGLASRAAWYGRGVALDAVASLAWHACPGCDPWSAATIELPLAADQQAAGWAPLAAATRMDRIRALSAAGAHAQASLVIANELPAGLLAGHEPEAQALLASSGRARWSLEVEPLVATGQPMHALALAEALVALAPGDAELTAGRDRIRAAAAASAVERSGAAAARGLPIAAAFHAVRASQLGAAIAIPTVDLAALWIDLPVRPQFVLPADCEWLRASLETVFPAPDPNVTITGTLTCASGVQLWEERQPYTWTESIPRNDTREVTTTTPQNCAATPVCTYIDGKSICDYNTGMVPCGTSSTTSTESYVAYDYVPHEAVRLVTGQRITIAVSGTMASPTASAPAAFDRVVDDFMYQDHTGFHDLTGPTFQAVQLEATAVVTAAVQQLITAAYLAQANVELAGAAAATDPLVAEEFQLRAQTLGYPSEALAATYELTVAQLVAAVTTGILGFPDVPFPAFTAGATPPLAPDGYALSHYPPEPTGAIESRTLEGHRTNQGLARLAMGTELTLERQRRDGGGVASSGFGARLERGWKLRRPFGLAPGFSLAGATDDEHGGSYEARVGGAIGLRSENHQLVYTLGVGAEGLGVRGADMTSSLTSKLDFSHGADLRLGAGPIALEGRLWQLRGGPLGRETRASAQLLVELGVWLIGAEASIRGFDTEDDDRITSFGLVLGFGTPRLR